MLCLSKLVDYVSISASFSEFISLSHNLTGKEAEGGGRGSKGEAMWGRGCEGWRQEGEGEGIESKLLA